MDIKNIDFGKIVESIQGEITMFSATLKEKTLNRFIRPLVISSFFIFAAYQFVYSPPEKKSAGIQRRIDSAKRTAQFADTYKGLHEQLVAIYQQLPQPKDREHWITDTFIEKLKADGLIAENMQPPDEDVGPAFATQKVTVSLTAKFSEVYALIKHLEANKPTLHVQRVIVEKLPQLEMNTMTCTVATIIPLNKAP